MATKLTKEQREAFEQWKEHCREVQALTAESLSVVKESPVEKERRIRRLLSNYDEFCEYYFAHFLTPARQGHRRGRPHDPQRPVPHKGGTQDKEHA